MSARARTRALCGFLLAMLLFACKRDEPLVPPTLAQALAGLPRSDTLLATLRTSEGDVRCMLTPALTPRAVALFVGLARGRAVFRDPRSQALLHAPMYRDLPFFRAIPGVLVQSGCPIGNGTGHPGYRIPVESTPDDAARLAQRGALTLARYQPAPNREDPAPPPAGHVIGSQFVISLTDMHHLAGQVSVIGSCQDLAIVRRIAKRVSSGQAARLAKVTF